jgi:hypothetical protein
MAKTQKATGNGRLTHQEFFLRAIKALRTPGYDGIHAVISGFNRAFREYYPQDDVIEIGAQLAAKGIVRIVPCKRGVMIFDGSSPAPERKSSPNVTLGRILG